MHDDLVDQFFREYESNWGVSGVELLQVSFRTQWVMPILDAPPPSSPTSTSNGFSSSGAYSHPLLVVGTSPLNTPRAPYHAANPQDARFSDRLGNLREDRSDHVSSGSYLENGVVSEERSTAGGGVGGQGGGSMTSSTSSPWAASPRT